MNRVMKLKFYTRTNALRTSLRSTYIGLVCLAVGLLTATVSMGQTAGVLDDFADGNIIAGPAWTLTTGIPTITAGELVFATPSGSNGGGLNMYTNFTTACQQWSFSIRSSSSSNVDIFRYFFILKDSPDPTNAAADGYYIQYFASSGDFILGRLDNGIATTLNTFDGSPTAPTAARNIKVTLSSAGLFEFFVNNISTTVPRFTVNDASYKSCLTQYQAIRVIDATSTTTSYTYYADNFAYVTWPCTNPADGGTIGNAQAQCAPFDPAALTELTPPTCYYGTLEYKWQVSDDGSLSGFTDIAGAISVSYNPPFSNQRAFYKRLTRVTCAAPWLESNVIPVYISNFITGYPKDDTVYNQLGNAIFGVEVSMLSGNAFQWQVSTDGGTSWSNIFANATYIISTPAANPSRSFLNVTNPTYAMHQYQYRCVITNVCGTVESNGGTLNVLPMYNFSNTTTETCGSWDGTLNKTITVAGIGTLNTGTMVLKQINVKMGKNCSPLRNFDTYDFRLTSPTGVVYNFITNLTNNVAGNWIDMRFRDHVSLERIRDLSDITQDNYFPYSIGYYGVDGLPASDFQTVFNGANADGDWTFTVSEQAAANGASFEGVELIFGPEFSIADYSSITANNSCANALCIGSDSRIIIGTNDLFSPNDPNYPGGTVGTCAWNQANNNSAWYYFWASATTAYISVSGMRTDAMTYQDMQLIVLNGSNGCAGPWSVPTGGCADDETINNRAYLSVPNQGGTTIGGTVYVNGITANAEFRLQGLTPGQRYYLYIDGMGGRSSTYYIEATSGCQACILNSILPVEFLTFNAVLKNNRVDLQWQTGTEKDNHYFQVERSADGLHWLPGERKQGAGNSSAVTSYEAVDYHPLPGISYYRIKQVGYNEQVTYSEVRTIYNQQKGIAVFPNPTADVVVVSGLVQRTNNTIRLVDAAGKLVQEYKTNSSTHRIDLTGKAPGIYFLIVNGTEHLQVVKTK